MEKYILAFSDLALSSEPKMSDLFGPKMGLQKEKAPKIELNFGFMSSFIYFPHMCKNGELRANLVTSFNRLTTPNLNIFQAELVSQVKTSQKLDFFIKLLLA